MFLADSGQSDGEETMAKRRVLFLCSYNSVRSQMAEGLLRHVAGDRFDVFSAGLYHSEVNTAAIAVLREVGIDISRQRSKEVGEYLGKADFDYVITVCDAASPHCPAFPGHAEQLYWPIADPISLEGSAAMRLAAFRATRNEIRRRIGAWLEALEAADKVGLIDRNEPQQT
jgi:arsenate reductase (thioredoxin)